VYEVLTHNELSAAKSQSFCL